MSYFKYLDSRARVKYFKESGSFITYSVEYSEKLKSNVVYIRDIYVEEEGRQKGLASKLADSVANQAELMNIPYLLGSTDLADVDVELSMKAQLGYGFKYLEISGSIMFWYKEIE